MSLLSEFRDIDTIHHLERVVLNDQGIPVIGAIRSLSHIGAVRAIPTLEELLRRRLSEDIRIEAERAIFEIRSKSLKDRTDDAASAYIEQLLNSLNSDSCFEAASAVAELSSQHPYLSNDERLTILHGIRDYVQPQVMDKDKTLFDALIAVALWRNGEKEKIEIVFNLLKSSDSHERVNAVTALSLVHIPRTTDALVEIMLHDESPPVVYASVDSLAKVGDLSTVPLLRTAAQRDPENLRDAVQRAVDQIVKREGPSGPEAHTEGAVKLP